MPVADVEQIGAIEYGTSFGAPSHIRTDSQYVRNGFTSWLEGWHTSYRKRVLNQDLRKRLDKLKREHPEATIEWVRGPAGDPDNERADALANEAASAARSADEEILVIMEGGLAHEVQFPTGATIPVRIEGYVIEVVNGNLTPGSLGRPCTATEWTP